MINRDGTQDLSGKPESMNTHTERLKIQNAHSYPLTIQLEPWGEEIPMSAGVTFTDHAHSDDRRKLLTDGPLR